MSSQQTVSLRKPTLPEATANGLREYVKNRHPPGYFLKAVLENNLLNAVKHADTKNLQALPEIVNYIYYKAPSICWGSPKKVREWLDD